MGIRLHRLLLASVVLASLFGSVPAQAAENPSQFVTEFLDDAFELFRAQGTTVEERRAALGVLFTARMDIPHMAQFMTMGQLTAAPPEGQQRFEDLLVGYLVDTFYARIAEGAAASFDVSRAGAPSPSSNLAVDSIIRKPGSPPEPITWHLRPAEESYRIVDVISDGISLAVLYRDVFAAVMRNGGLSRLEEVLTARQ